MKKLLILSFVGMLSLQTLKSQETSSFKEIGLYFTDLKFDNFGFIFKTGNNKLIYRFSGLSVNLGYRNIKTTNLNYDFANNYQANSGSSFRINFGIEKPLIINENFNLYYGAELQGSLTGKKSSDENLNLDSSDSFFSAGVGFIFGSTIKINKNLKLSAEFVPNLAYSQTKTNLNSISEQTNSGLGFNLNNNWAALILGYRF